MNITYFINHYEHCDIHWEDQWSCACNDRCPVCNQEIEPVCSEEFSEEVDLDELEAAAGIYDAMMQEARDGKLAIADKTNATR